MNSLNFMDAADQVIRGATQYLKRNGGKVGLTGFCLGGALTVIGSTRIPELDAAVCFYGIPPEAAAKPADIRCHSRVTSRIRTTGARLLSSMLSRRVCAPPASRTRSSATMPSMDL